ncbi:helix-turn-helix transcriptional regulator [Sphingosinicella rhizophila]|uniref:LuxR family transcriptional regulator n=1 Tax=Sphingosinicella rhizophila TaxID=3050082 RepID=A0ABU3Q6D0_9SPHN|nr:LuxR family transcriptional regulator [Sphingosinicella sp. GR2756]MDT9598964.1 LuxR family transcriptional regulator [Sphingosinicella sp. GR2756]
MGSLTTAIKTEKARDGLGLVQDFVKAAAKVEGMAELRNLLDAATRELAFDYYAIVHHIRFGQPSKNQVRLSNYPLDWLAIIRELEKMTDPVIRAAERMSSGFKWERLDSLLVQTQAERDYMEQAARHEIMQGFTVPNHVPGETFGSCHFVVKGSRDFPDDNVSAAQALGAFAFEAARRLINENPENSETYVRPAPLSDRQRECLLFVARGKSDSVIAQLLNIRPRTVNEHIESAKRRYSVATRSQLLVKALFRSEICFSEVMD